MRGEDRGAHAKAPPSLDVDRVRFRLSCGQLTIDGQPDVVSLLSLVSLEAMVKVAINQKRRELARG